MYRERETVETPERVLLEFDLAGPASRLWAALLDGILLAGLLCLVLLGVVLAETAGAQLLTLDVAGAALVAGAGLLCLGYFPFFEMRWNGQTPGKRAVGIRVARVDSRPLDLRAVLVRGVLRIIDLQPAPTGLVGLIAMVSTRRCMRLGDMAAGTWVLRARPVPVVAGARDPGAAAPPPEVDGAPGRLLPREHEIVGRFLARAPDLAGDVRTRLAAEVARPIFDRLGESAPDAEAFLRAEHRRGRGKSLL